MTDEQHTEGAPEEIEDLEAPASALGDVLGGDINCATPTCVNDPQGRTAGPIVSAVQVFCQSPTCAATKSQCGMASEVIVLHLT